MPESTSSQGEPTQTPQQAPTQTASFTGTADQTKVIVTIVALFFVYPLGLVFVWVWMNWPKWVKISLSLLLLLPIILGYVAAMALVAINPAEQFAKAGNVKRTSDVNAIANAISQYKLDNAGLLPYGVSTEPTVISSDNLDLCPVLVPTYLTHLPRDILNENGDPITDCSLPYDTGYAISVNNNGEVTVTALNAELDASISITR